MTDNTIHHQTMLNAMIRFKAIVEKSKKRGKTGKETLQYFKPVKKSQRHK